MTVKNAALMLLVGGMGLVLIHQISFKVHFICLARNLLCDGRKRCHGVITDNILESAVDCGQDYVIKVVCKLRHVPAGCRGGGLAFARNIHPATVKSTNTIHHAE